MHNSSQKSDSAGQTDYTLINRALDLNDKDAWDELYKIYSRFIHYMFRQFNVASADLNDLHQQVMITLMRDLENFDSKKASFRTWLSHIIRNHVYMHFRKVSSRQRKHQGLTDKILAEGLVEESELDAYIDSEWKDYLIHLAMERVKASYQGRAVEVFELFLDGKNVSEIVVETGLSKNTVYTLKKRVKKSLFLELKAVKKEVEPYEEE